MAWYGNDPAIEFTNVDDLRAYIKSLNYGNWRPSNFVVHNTASPTLYQWWNSVPPAQRMENLQHYYNVEMGWSSGPHFFIDGVSWWCMTPPNVKGVHSPSWNGSMLGFEHVGDYDTESATTGMGAKVQEMGHQLSAICCEFFGWDPERLKFHYEDPNTDHACPGSNMSKPTYISQVQETMGDGGDDQQPPPTGPRIGVVAGLDSGDTLNIRATSSSSALVIGQAENGDRLTVVGEAWNGSTKWLRIQVGTNVGTGLALFGWCSAAYVKVQAAPAPPHVLTEAQIEEICRIANNSPIARYSWRDRGVAPTGFTQGLALSYAQSYLKLQQGHPATLIMASARTPSDKDVFQIYRQEFDQLRMSNEQDGVACLRHLYAFMLGSGMRESSGRHCEGRDLSADNVSSDTAESGLFQTSYNAHTASDPEFSNLMTEYSAPENEAACYLSQFDDGVSCTESEWQSYGSGQGLQFQDLCKKCPAFAVETHGLTLRNLSNHYGPVVRREVELKSDADRMLQAVQDFMDNQRKLIA